MVGDGPFNSLSTYNVSQLCNVSRYAKCVQNLCKNLAPVLRFAPVQKCSTGAKWASYLLLVGMGMTPIRHVPRSKEDPGPRIRDLDGS